MEPNEFLSPGFYGLEIHTSEAIPYNPPKYKGWEPMGKNRILMNPKALEDFLKYMGKTQKDGIL
jgi:hypothetical protein